MDPNNNDNQDPNNNQSDQLDTNNPPPDNQPANNNPTGHTNNEPDDATLLRAALAEQHQQMNAMRSQLEQLTKQSAPPQPTIEELNQRYFTDPVGVVRNEIQTAIEPLIELRRQFTRDTELTRIKAQLKRDPQLGRLFSGEVEGIYDQIMAQNEPREDLAKAALLSAIGYAAASNKLPDQNTNKDLPKPNANDAPNAQQPKMNTPAHLKPSGNPAPQNNDKPSRRQLTESEKLLARRKGMTDEQWLDELEGTFSLTTPGAKK